MPLFSIIIPAYEAEGTIKRALDSLRDQTFQDFEVIVIDDGSHDGTWKVLEKEKEILKGQLIIKHVTNGGSGQARNIGLSLAKGEYVIFLDADDSIDKEQLMMRKEILDSYPTVDLIVGGYHTSILTNNKIVRQSENIPQAEFYKTHEDFLDHLYALMEQQLMYVVWNKIYRLDLLKKYHVAFPLYQSCEDRLFNLAYYGHVQQCYISERIFYHYAFDPANSLTNRFVGEKFRSYVESFQQSLDLIPDEKENLSTLFLKGVLASIIQIHSEKCTMNKKSKYAYIENIFNHSVTQCAIDEAKGSSFFQALIIILFKTKSKHLFFNLSKLIYQLEHSQLPIIESLKSSF